jgi:ribosomal protein S5
MRAAFESVGIKDVVAKALNSTNPHNILKATIKALLMLKDELYYKSLPTGLISGTIDDNEEE